jgi:hypothetical protein
MDTNKAPAVLPRVGGLRFREGICPIFGFSFTLPPMEERADSSILRVPAAWVVLRGFKFQDIAVYQVGALLCGKALFVDWAR